MFILSSNQLKILMSICIMSLQFNIQVNFQCQCHLNQILFKLLFSCQPLQPSRELYRVERRLGKFLSVLTWKRRKHSDIHIILLSFNIQFLPPTLMSSFLFFLVWRRNKPKNQSLIEWTWVLSTFFTPFTASNLVIGVVTFVLLLYEGKFYGVNLDTYLHTFGL